uniref:Uncharacterized protein n=1 Tax=Arundo donax TaxID=35708 RepID=A0A0A9CB86_ARUDO
MMLRLIAASFFYYSLQFANTCRFGQGHSQTFETLTINNL